MSDLKKIELTRVNRVVSVQLKIRLKHPEDDLMMSFGTRVYRGGIGRPAGSVVSHYVPPLLRHQETHFSRISKKNKQLNKHQLV